MVQPPPTASPSAARRVPLLAIAAAVGLALSASRRQAAMEAVVVDALLLAVLAALTWTTVRARHGERGAGGAALTLVLFAPLLGAVGGGGLPAALFLAAGLTCLTRCLLDPTLQLIAAAGACLGLAAAVLEVDGVARGAVLAWLAAGGAALVAWRASTVERCEPRRRVVHGAAVSAVLVAVVAAAVLAAVDALPPLETTEYAQLRPAAAAMPRAAASGWLLALNALPLVVLPAARRWRWTSRYADGAALIGLAVALGLGARVPVLLGLLAAPWLALLAGAAMADRSRPGLRRLGAVVLVVQALTAVLLWPDYPRASAGWSPLPAAVEGLPT
jgi:hypothetical protein